jgi:ABC-type Fe3+/spermidine/putrescine transport system ATPase subunit
MYSLEVKDIIMKYDNFTALSHVSLKVKKGEFLTLLGPSGCGKTTLLKIISGFIEPSNGNIFINQVDVTKTQPETRNTAMCFQSYALFPHLTVFQNLSFGLIQRNVNIKKREQILDEVVTQLELTSELKKLPNQLSGGQQQRVALGRALVMRPEVILFDEPLSNLDALLRESVRIEIKRIVKLFNLTAIYVTHDQNEALSLSDRIALMHEGKIIQIDDSETIYTNPKNKFVANFLGSSNIIQAKLIKKGNKKNEWIFQSKIGKLIVYSEETSFKSEVHISWRSEKVIFNKSSDNIIKGKIENTFFLGSHYEVFVKVNDEIVKINVSDKSLLEKEITFFLDKRDLKILED